MIKEEYSKFGYFTTDSVEGKLLLATISILTSIEKKDICEGKFGGMNDPNTVMEHVWELANKVFHEEEFKNWQFIQLRDQKISDIVNEGIL